MKTRITAAVTCFLLAPLGGLAHGESMRTADVVPPFNVEPLVLKGQRISRELAGRTLVNQGVWPFRVYIGAEGRYLGLWALDEKGVKIVRVDGRWAVKGDQICIVDDGRDKEICRFMALVGERVLIFDEGGKLAYSDVTRVAGNQIKDGAAGADRTH